MKFFEVPGAEVPRTTRLSVSVLQSSLTAKLCQAKRSRLSYLLLALTLTAAAPSSAGLLLVDSYSMLNGESSNTSDNSSNNFTNNLRAPTTYHDESYNGTGNNNSDLAQLSGGTGDLTDGFIANASWSSVEPSDPDGPYVGWLTTNPLISFFFADLVNITRVTIWGDNSVNNSGVRAPRAVSFNGAPELSTNATPSPVSTASYVFDVNFTSTSLDLQIFDFKSGGGTLQSGQTPSWLMISEIQFEGEVVNPSADVPTPGTLVLFASGLLGVAFRRRVKFR
ncbi:MAG: PEP-CTERM sorting domain-containing protein [Pseudomonadota bacterium]